LNGLSTRELVQQIQLRGVDFGLTPELEAELSGAGARPEVVEAARASYRPPVAAARPAAAGKNTANVPAGPPLSESEIILLLQSGKPAPEVEGWVEKRGANFRVTPVSSKKQEPAKPLATQPAAETPVTPPVAAPTTQQAETQQPSSGGGGDSSALPTASSPSAVKTGPLPVGGLTIDSPKTASSSTRPAAKPAAPSKPRNNDAAAEARRKREAALRALDQ